MSDTPIYDQTLGALLADDPLAHALQARVPEQRRPGGRHRLRDTPPPAVPAPRTPTRGEPALAYLAADQPVPDPGRDTLR